MLPNKIVRLIRAFKREIHALIEFIVVYAPSDYLGQFVRRHYWQFSAKIGSSPRFDRGTRLIGLGSIQIGKNFVLGENSVVAAGECKGIYIGDWVGFAPGCYVRSANHRADDIDIPFMLQGHEAKVISYLDRKFSVVIESDVWIGAHAIILSGAKISRGCVVAAGCVVGPGDYPEYSVLIGNPARIAGNRKKNAQRKILGASMEV